MGMRSLLQRPPRRGIARLR